MSDILHKIKDAVSHHHDHTHDHAKEKKHSSSGHSKANGARTDLDLNCARSSTHDPVDLTGRHVDPDDRDLDGSRRSHDHDAPDLTGPHHEHDSVDINGQHPSTHDAPDLVPHSRQ
ncbi:hypothetical protein GQX73_g3301 [Xylaria multiplex]|uniref:Uncharacterized protein n=1 Tax=Xylaria multiplex TaxID=323545 RepID=A0A7C8MTM2_9PEZI|nr:hypothetical protein GQX73_g3301 [Xylaria multiplex]